MALANELPYLNFTSSSYEAHRAMRTERGSREESAPIDLVGPRRARGTTIEGGERFNLRGTEPAAMVLTALTGTPGTGKTTVAGRLPRGARASEVLELADRMGAARSGTAGDTGPWTVDLARMRRAWGRGRLARDGVLVGHLAHLLPVRDVIVLRCHPRELERRLGRHRRQGRRERDENLVAEATDVILIEAIRPGHRVWEIDTTARSPSDVALEVRRLLRRRPPPSYGRVDWLADPWVTAHLLDWSR
jgi:adenylate kinase